MTKDGTIFDGRFHEMLIDQYETSNAHEMMRKVSPQSFDFEPCLDREKKYKYKQYDRMIRLSNKGKKKFNPSEVLYGERKLVAFDDDMVL